MQVKLDKTDNPTYYVKMPFPRRLHECMKELAKRKRITVGLAYEWAIEEYLSQLDTMSYPSAVLSEVQIEIERTIHDRARDARTVSAIYEIAAYEYLSKDENYLGKGFELQRKTEKNKGVLTNGKQKGRTKD
jgi:hypothetical protein